MMLWEVQSFIADELELERPQDVMIHVFKLYEEAKSMKKIVKDHSICTIVIEIF